MNTTIVVLFKCKAIDAKEQIKTTNVCEQYVGMLNRTRVIIMNSFYANLKHIIATQIPTMLMLSEQVYAD